MFREPPTDKPYRLPVGGETRMPVFGYCLAMVGFLRPHEVDAGALGDDRAVSLPLYDASVAGTLEVLRRVAGDRPLGEIEAVPDRNIEAIVATWPGASSHKRATPLGLLMESDLDEIVCAYS